MRQGGLSLECGALLSIEVLFPQVSSDLKHATSSPTAGHTKARTLTHTPPTAPHASPLNLPSNKEDDTLDGLLIGLSTFRITIKTGRVFLVPTGQSVGGEQCATIKGERCGERFKMAAVNIWRYALLAIVYLPQKKHKDISSGSLAVWI